MDLYLDDSSYINHTDDLALHTLREIISIYRKINAEKLHILVKLWCYLFFVRFLHQKIITIGRTFIARTTRKIQRPPNVFIA